MTRRPLYLRPASYRRRRRHDAARLLPFVGAFLFLLPLLWAPARGTLRDTAQDGIYLFVVWAVMIGLAFAITRGLRSHDEGDETALPPDPKPPAAGGDTDPPQRTG